MKVLCFLLALTAAPSLAPAANLVINDVSKGARVFVYELPDAEGRAEAIRYVQAIRDRFKPKAEVIDAAAMSEATAREKLKHGFLLYTTLGEKSKLLRAATGKLGWQLSGDVFRWGELSAPVANLRFILAGKNPYSAAHCVVYAAGSNRALADINSVFHGPSSYHVFNGNELLKEGYYDENLVSRERVTKAAALEDVKQFFATLERVHPNLLAKMSAEDYRKLKELTAAGVAEKGAEIGVEDLASLLYYAAASFKDGHTSVRWTVKPAAWNTRERRFPPFRLRFDNGRFMITAAKDPALAGTELVSVNGAPAAEFLRPILDRCSGETIVFRAHRFTGNQPFWFYLTNVFGAGTPYRLGLRDAAGNAREAPVESLGYTEYEEFMGLAVNRPRPRGTKVEFLDSGAVAHFIYPAFQMSDTEKQRVDGIFKEIKARGSRDVVLDIRGNGGGNSNMGEHIFAYLYAGKFQSFSKMALKISPDIAPHLPTWARPMAAVMKGKVVTRAAGEHAVPRPEAFFSGRTWLLVDNGTFSSATDFAAMFRDYEVGTILGYETGGVPTTFGDVHAFQLKNSGIPCGVSWKQFFPPRPKPGDDEHGVLPHIAVNDRMLADFRNEPDPVLALTLRHIRQKRGLTADSPN